MKEVLEIYELIDRPGKLAKNVIHIFSRLPVITEYREVASKKGSTEFIKMTIPGKNQTKKSKKKTIGIIGRLGGVGARPDIVGLVSDGDGALTVLSVALKLARMKERGDVFESDVIIATHLCSNAPTIAHDPVPFMGSPIDIAAMNAFEVDPKMDVILSVDTSRGNKIINTNSFAITPTVKAGWILKVSDDLQRIMEQVTGSYPRVVPITMQDITPYGNGVFHFNSIMQPATATDNPVVGIAITSESTVPGSATGVSNAYQIDLVGRYIIEVVQGYSNNTVSFYDKKEFDKIVSIYGEMKKLQK